MRGASVAIWTPCIIALENECMMLMDMMVVVSYEDIFEPLEGLVMFYVVRQEN